jgi:uroporphyrinogen-III synthase
LTRLVLITHRAGTWPGLVARFQGTSVTLQLKETTTQADPIDPRPGDHALRALDGCSWLVVTSARGAAALERRLAAQGTLRLPPKLHVAAVGGATAEALAAIGVRVDLVASESSSAGLAADLSARLTPGARVLVVRPEGAPGPLTGLLAAVGAEVEEAPLYRTIASEHAAGLAAAAIAGAYAAVVFTAPSSLDLWLAAAGERRDALVAALARTARVAIGPTTAARLEAAGLPADAVAETPTELAIGDAIARALRL